MTSRVAFGAPVLLAALATGGAAVAQAPPGSASALGVDTPLAPAPRPRRSVAWAESLPALEIVSQASGQHATVRLYAEDGSVDAEACERFEAVVAGTHDPHPLARRLEQLVFKAAYHFGARRVVVVSGWREHAGRHTSGEALDFKLDEVQAGALAAWLRKLARVGVGIYTHPRTRYVHLDVREQSYHWLDASPPGITWKERGLWDPKLVERDAAWTPEADLPTVEPSRR